MLGLESATAGSVTFDGQDLTTLSSRELRPLRKELGMIFQNPFSSLNERMTVGQIVREPMEIHDEYTGRRNERVAELLDRVGLDPYDHFDRFPHELSGGQRQRVSIARALALNPSVVVADEPVSALDVSVQAQILALLADLQDEYDLSYMFISHDLSVVRHIADHVGVMYLGRMVETAPVDDLFDDPTHPYTQALLSDVPRVGVGRGEFDAIELEGTPPNPRDPPSGCNFHTRCQLKPELSEAEQERCVNDDPTLDGTRGHCVACHFRHADD